MKRSLTDCLRHFLIGSGADIQKSSYIWNTLSGILNAGQSVLVLMTLTRTVGMEEAGIFTIAYASAALFFTVGNYGMRSYQVTDTLGRYCFSDYLCSRIMTCAAMNVLGVFQVAYGYAHSGYHAYKIAVMLIIGLMRTVDAAEDVFTAFYQQQGRLDVGARLTFARQLLSVVCLCVLLISGRNLLISSIAALAVSVGVSVWANRTAMGMFRWEKTAFSLRTAMNLLWDCMGPFAAGFLSFYLANAPKYAIDVYLPQETQAYYGFISMPVLIVGLLNSFLYQPILPSLAADWNEGRRKLFVRRAGRQMLVIFGISLCVLVGAYLLGIPALSLLYHADLRPYKAELLILLTGSGMLAMAGFTNILLTILRYQRDLIGGYFLTAVLAFLLSPVFVRRWGISGASWVYTILVGGLALLFAGILAVRIRREQIRPHGE